MDCLQAASLCVCACVSKISFTSLEQLPFLFWSTKEHAPRWREHSPSSGIEMLPKCNYVRGAHTGDKYTAEATSGGGGTHTDHQTEVTPGSCPLTPSVGAGRALNSCLVKSKQWPCCDKGRRCWNAPLFSGRNPRTHCCRSPSGTGPETGLPALWKAG